jgi:hypothetical protein
MKTHIWYKTCYIFSTAPARNIFTSDAHKNAPSFFFFFQFQVSGCPNLFKIH